MRHLQRFFLRFFLGFAGLAAIAGASIVLAADHAARAQIARTIRIVVPYAPGGTADIDLNAAARGRSARSNPPWPKKSADCRDWSWRRPCAPRRSGCLASCCAPGSSTRSMFPARWELWSQTSMNGEILLVCGSIRMQPMHSLRPVAKIHFHRETG